MKNCEMMLVALFKSMKQAASGTSIICHTDPKIAFFGNSFCRKKLHREKIVHGDCSMVWCLVKLAWALSLCSQQKSLQSFFKVVKWQTCSKHKMNTFAKAFGNSLHCRSHGEMELIFWISPLSCLSFKHLHTDNHILTSGHQSRFWCSPCLDYVLCSGGRWTASFHQVSWAESAGEHFLPALAPLRRKKVVINHFYHLPLCHF